MAGNTRSTMDHVLLNRTLGISLAILSAGILLLAIPQMGAAWLTAPAGLDHTQVQSLTPDERADYRSALQILPQAQTAYMLADADLSNVGLTTLARENDIAMLQAAAEREPGNTHVWYLLSAALEPELFSPGRRALWDHALSMSLLTGPYARDLAMPRAMIITRHWNEASDAVKGLWQDQITHFWGMAPDDVHDIYAALPTAGQKILFDTLGEAP